MSTPEESTPVPAPKSAARIVLGTWITVTNILALGSLVPWASLVLCSMMSYPPKEKDFEYYFFRATIYAYPFIILGLAIFTWYAYKKGWNLAAQITSIVSILPVLWFVLMLFNVM
ncbi:MAG: hypothetical protein J0L96_21880 [Anaerolineae bacterium]|nr:hypothetical protein [Anaerolineae bacterium]